MSGGGSKLLNDPEISEMKYYTTNESAPVEVEITTPGLYYAEAYFAWKSGAEIPDTNKAVFQIARTSDTAQTQAALDYCSAKNQMSTTVNSIFKCSTGDKIQASVVNTSVGGATFNVQIKKVLLISDA